MCRAKSRGGRRCPDTALSRALDSLRHRRKSHPEQAEQIDAVISELKDAAEFYGGKFVSPHTMFLQPGVDAALEVLRSVGNPLVIGGAVRDSMAGTDSKDIDIEVFGTDLDTIISRFRSSGFQVDEVGRAFGVLKVSKKGVVTDLDVAVPRLENTTGAGHRDFEVSPDSSLTPVEAASRRDFTINTVAYDPSRKVLVDPFDGKGDLKSKVLRHVSDQFAEDPLRVLRGFQFAGRFGMTLAPETAKLCRDLRPHYVELATERVREEWAKFFDKSARPELGVKALQDTGWDDAIPGLKRALANDGVVKSLARLPKTAGDDRSVIGAAVIAAAMKPEDRHEFLSTVLLSKDAARQANDLATIVPSDVSTTYQRKVVARQLASKGFTFSVLERYAKTTGDAGLLKVARSAVKEGLGTGPEEDMVQGRDVLPGVSRKPGPWLGKLLDESRDRQYRGQFRTKDDAISWARDAALEDVD